MGTGHKSTRKCVGNAILQFEHLVTVKEWGDMLTRKRFLMAPVGDQGGF